MPKRAALMALVVGLATLGLGCENPDEDLDLRCSFSDPNYQFRIVNRETDEVYLRQSSPDGGAVAFDRRGSMGLGSDDEPYDCILDCRTTVFPVSDGTVTIQLWQVFASGVELIDTCEITILNGAFVPGDDEPDPNAAGPGGDGGTPPSPVRGLTVSADPTDAAQLLVRWTPGAGDVTEYRVRYTRSDGQVLEFPATTATELTIDPDGALGTVQVAAVNADGESNVAEALVQVFDIAFFFSDPDTERASGPAGIEWKPEEAGSGAAPVPVGSRATDADVYFTNMMPGVVEPFYVTSPHLADSDDHDRPLFSTTAGLKTTGIQDLGTTPPDVLPDPTKTTYTEKTELAVGHYYAIEMPDGYFGLILIESFGTELGIISGKVRVWSLPLRESRLIGLSQ